MRDKKEKIYRGGARETCLMEFYQNDTLILEKVGLTNLIYGLGLIA